MVGGGSNNSVALFSIEAEFGGRAIPAGDESSHSRDLTVHFSKRVGFDRNRDILVPHGKIYGGECNALNQEILNDVTSSKGDTLPIVIEAENCFPLPKT